MRPGWESIQQILIVTIEVPDGLIVNLEDLGLALPRNWNARPGELFLQHYGELINLNRAGQLGIQAVLKGLLQRLQWKDGDAVRFSPIVPSRPESRAIMLDPRVAFGRPVLAKLGVSTEVLVDRINAGEEAAALAADYGATEDEVMDALVYERAA